MRTADPDHVVECERVVWRQVERYLESFYRRNGVASIRVDPTAAAPGPCRSAVKRQRLANNHVRGIKLTEQRQGITDNRKNGWVAGKSPRLLGELKCPCALLLRLGGEMIDHPLNVSPGGKRRRQRVRGIQLHRSVQQFECTGISLGIERKHAWHGPQREFIRTEVRARFSQCMINLGSAQR